MSIDLHTHSTASDGSLSPSELVLEAKMSGVTVLGLTDHDTLSGVEEAQEKARELGVEFVPGIEFSTEVEESEIHILGYHLNPSPDLSSMLERLRESRMERIHLMLKKLQALKIEIDLRDVIKETKDGVYGRPQVAIALVRKGYVSSVEEAFQKYLGMGKPAYVPHFKISPWEAIELIREARGIPVYAHPGVTARDDLIPSFIKSGLLGLEVFYPEHDQQTTAKYLNLCRSFSLLVTGGSDFHGEARPGVRLGHPSLPEEHYLEFKAFLSSQQG
ncbi:MAG: PHP domain-containing protein [bacterium]